MDYAKQTFTTSNGNRDLIYRLGTSDVNILNQIFATRDYEFAKKLRRGDELLQSLSVLGSGRAPLIVDCGANFGASPIYFHYTVPGSHVIAIEPEASNYELLQMNTNGLPIDCIHAAIASRAGEVRVVDPSLRGNKASYRTELMASGQHTGESVPSVAINDLYASLGNAYFPYIVKVDIEGSEAELFSANTEWVDQTPLIIIELHDWLLTRQGVSRNFLRCISMLDRDFIHIGENIFSIKNDLMPLPPEIPSFWS